MDGEVSPPSEDSRLWNRCQLGGSCTARCLFSLIRSKLPKEEYRDFKDLARLEILLKTYREIKTGEGNSSLRKTVALGVIGKVKKNFGKRGVAIPQIILNIENELKVEEERSGHHQVHLNVRGLHVSEQDGHLIGDNFMTNLKLINRIFQANDLSDPSLRYIEPLLEKLIEQSNHPLLQEQIEEMVNISQAIAQAFKDKPLNDSQTYYLTALSSAIANSLNNSTLDGLGADFKEKKEEFDAFANTIHYRFHQRSIGQRIKNDRFDSLINREQEFRYPVQQGVTIPDGLKKMKETMSINKELISFQNQFAPAANGEHLPEVLHDFINWTYGHHDTLYEAKALHEPMVSLLGNVVDWAVENSAKALEKVDGASGFYGLIDLCDELGQQMLRAESPNTELLQEMVSHLGKVQQSLQQSNPKEELRRLGYLKRNWGAANAKLASNVLAPLVDSTQKK